MNKTILLLVAIAFTCTMCSVPANRSSQKAYETCLKGFGAASCHSRTPEQWESCDEGKKAYNACISSSKCSEWNSVKSSLSSEEQLPVSFFECLDVCEPSQDNQFHNAWEGIVACASLPEMSLQSVPVFPSSKAMYNKCLSGFGAASCHARSPADWVSCNAGKLAYKACVATSSECSEWNSVESSLSDSEVLPASFFKCQDACEPSESTLYHNAWEGMIQCASLPRMSLESAQTSSTTKQAMDKCLSGFGAASCHNRTPEDWTSCDEGKKAYNACIATSSKCSEWNSVKQSLSGEQYLPASLYTCLDACEPTQTTKFHSAWEGIVFCANVNSNLY